jgi:U5 small nuclear ribonucleoprotein component
MDQYDEFGNYIGPEDEDDLEDDVYLRHDDVNESEEIDMAQEDMNDMDVVEENRIILHEDKKYYPDAEEIYPGVRTVTLDEDAQDLNEPIIKPVKPKVFSVLESEAPALKYEADFMTGLMSTPSLIRNVVLLGQFHHGKSCFADILVQSTHQNEWEPGKEVRYSDSRKDEQDRQLSIKSTLLSLVLDDLKEKSYLLNIIDTPGHINFTDEATAGICAADGAIIVVDAVEGVMMNTERLVKQAVAARLAITLVRSYLFQEIYILQYLPFLCVLF